MAWKLTHPETGQTIERERDQVAIYVSQGWQTAKNAPPTPDVTDE